MRASNSKQDDDSSSTDYSSSGSLEVEEEDVDVEEDDVEEEDEDVEDVTVSNTAGKGEAAGAGTRQPVAPTRGLRSKIHPTRVLRSKTTSIVTGTGGKNSKKGKAEWKVEGSQRKRKREH